jgi:hypothetical protein
MTARAATRACNRDLEPSTLICRRMLDLLVIWGRSLQAIDRTGDFYCRAHLIDSHRPGDRSVVLSDDANPKTCVWSPRSHSLKPSRYLSSLAQLWANASVLQLQFRFDRRMTTKGVRRQLLAPFRYFGVPDDVDYVNIPWRSTHFDEEVLTTAVATQRRAENALDQFRTRGGTRAHGFCVSKRHADFMASFFVSRGLRAVAVHSGDTSAPRALSLEQLEQGELDIVFAVDMFNEGVDLPTLDTVMMLRPTESRILWLQQFGRGLRTAPGKERLTVIDYIGNHRVFLLKPQTLFGLRPGD